MNDECDYVLSHYVNVHQNEFSHHYAGVDVCVVILIFDLELWSFPKTLTLFQPQTRIQKKFGSGLLLQVHIPKNQSEQGLWCVLLPRVLQLEMTL